MPIYPATAVLLNVGFTHKVFQCDVEAVKKCKQENARTHIQDSDLSHFKPQLFLFSIGPKSCVKVSDIHNSSRHKLPQNTFLGDLSQLTTGHVPIPALNTLPSLPWSLPCTTHPLPTLACYANLPALGHLCGLLLHGPAGDCLQ